MFLSVGTGLGAGLVLRGELQRGHTARPESSTTLPSASSRRSIRAPLRFRPLRRGSRSGAPTTLSSPYDARSIFAAARAGDTLARDVVKEEARRIALHIAPIAAVTDVGLVVLGGGIGANAELLADVRPLLAKWLPYPPRVEISSLGDGAVLMGAVAVGLRSALDAVFVSRRGRGAASG